MISTAHFCNLKLTFISYSFWNIRWKVLTFYKFDEKRAITPRWVFRFTSKYVQHVKIYLPCNFEVNLITHLGVIALFSSFFFYNFNTFRLIFQKLFRDRCEVVGRSWYAVHFCNLKLTFISYRFWNIRRKVLTFYKFDEKRAITPRWVIRFTSKLQGM
jgi:hypothetical protein